MRALTIYQPWAWAIVEGHKRVENRGWRTHYRGRLVIHAAAGAGAEFDFDWCRGIPGLDVPEPDELPYGALVGEVEVYSCVPEGEHDPADPWADEWHGFKWLLRAPVAYRHPVPCRGRQGLWLPGRDALAQAQGR